MSFRFFSFIVIDAVDRFTRAARGRSRLARRRPSATRRRGRRPPYPKSGRRVQAI
jgi:hypothetical protein